MMEWSANLFWLLRLEHLDWGDLAQLVLHQPPCHDWKVPLLHHGVDVVVRELKQPLQRVDPFLLQAGHGIAQVMATQVFGDVLVHGPHGRPKEALGKAGKHRKGKETREDQPGTS